jgi:hypothetical protein
VQNHYIYKGQECWGSKVHLSSILKYCQYFLGEPMIFIKVCIGGEDITHMVQTNEQIEFF